MLREQNLMECIGICAFEFCGSMGGESAIVCAGVKCRGVLGVKCLRGEWVADVKFVSHW